MDDTFDAFDPFGTVAGAQNTAHTVDGFETFDPFGTTGATDPFATTSTADTSTADTAGAARTTGAFGAAAAVGATATTGVIGRHGVPNRRRGGGGGRRRRPRKGDKTRAAGILAVAAAVSVIAVIAYTSTDGSRDDGLPPDGGMGPDTIPTVGPTLPSKGAPTTQSPLPPASDTSAVGHQPGPTKSPAKTPSPSGGSSPDKPSKTHPPKHAEPVGITCTARYSLDNQWPDGFQAKVTLTPRKTVHEWRLSWEFENGQQITQMWNGEFVQHGRKVTVTPADYNETARGGEALEVGFLGSWDAGNAAPTDLALNGRRCDTP